MLSVDGATYVDEDIFSSGWGMTVSDPGHVFLQDFAVSLRRHTLMAILILRTALVKTIIIIRVCKRQAQETERNRFS